MRLDATEFMMHWLVNFALIVLPWREGGRLSDWEFSWLSRRRVAKARKHIQKSAPPSGEPGCEQEAKRQEALLALWRQLQTCHPKHFG